MYFLKFQSIVFHAFVDEDTLRKPVLQANRRNILIEQVEIDMKPSINQFEEELCRYISVDRIENNQRSQTASTNSTQEVHNKVSIVERRLRVRYSAFFKILA